MENLDTIIFVDVDESEVPSYNYREQHFIAAKELGLFCVTIINESRENKDRIFVDSDKVISVKNIDFDCVLNAVKDLQQVYNIKALFCHAGHTSSYGEVATVVSDVADLLGLRYSRADAITACNNKSLMRYLFKQKNIRTVEFACCNSIEEVCENALLVGFPLIAKPIFGASSAFTKKCNNLDELTALYHDYTSNYINSRMIDFYGLENDIKISNELTYKYTPGKSILLEQFIEGIEATVECVVYNEEVYPILLNEKLIIEHKNSTILENLLISPVSSFSQSQVEEIKKYAKDCISAIGLSNDIVHFEFIMSNNGPIVIEINPRLGGLYVNSAFNNLAGIDPYKLYILMLLGDPSVEHILNDAMKNVNNCSKSYSMLVIYPDNCGKFIGFNGIDFVKKHGQVCEYDNYPINNYVNADVEENYLLKVWACVKDKDDALNLYQQIRENVSPIIINS